MPSRPTRKRIRLPDYDYSQTGCYFITICTKDGCPLLGNITQNAEDDTAYVTLTQTGNFIQTYLEKMNTSTGDISLERYVIMPNHIHLLIAIQRERTGTAHPSKAMIPNIVHGIKSATTRQIGVSIWQRSYHEHVVRSEKTYLRICRYIDENPQKWVEDCYYVRDM